MVGQQPILKLCIALHGNQQQASQQHDVIKVRGGGLCFFHGKPRPFCEGIPKANNHDNAQCQDADKVAEGANIFVYEDAHAPGKHQHPKV